MNCSYNPKFSNTESHLKCLSRSIDSLSLKCEYTIVFGDLIHTWMILL